MATKIVDQHRAPIFANPGDDYTIKRKDAKSLENVRLIAHFANWLSQITGKHITGETFSDDLRDGIALCKVMIMIGPDSGVSTFHDLPQKNAVLDAWKAKENVVAFQEACKRLALPVVFGMSEIEAGDYGKMASCLIFVAHSAAVRGVGVQQMDAELRARVESVSMANASVLESSPSAAAIPESSETATVELTWWQQLLVRFGLADFIDFDLTKLKAYALKLKADLEAQAAAKIEPLQKQALERVASLKENLPDAVKARLVA